MSTDKQLPVRQDDTELAGYVLEGNKCRPVHGLTQIPVEVVSQYLVNVHVNLDVLNTTPCIRYSEVSQKSSGTSGSL